METSILMLGPGGDYVTHYEAVGSRLVKAKKVGPAIQGQAADNPTDFAYQHRHAKDDQSSQPPTPKTATRPLVFQILLENRGRDRPACFPKPLQN